MKSGALISANLTLEQGRELMCIPGAINNVNTEGVYKLIKDGASIVTSGDDILNVLNWEKTQKAGEAASENSGNIPQDPVQKLIFDIIGVEPKSFDEIQGLTKLDTESLLTALTMMELEGFAEKTEGDRYKRV